ncbi:MAG: hypothetical protein JWN34_5814 [Bryobacterales bacterium]|nr:hypothetical protein [Bryobacterales bacterium]
MFENQLIEVVRFEYEGVLIEALNATGKFDAAQQVDRDEPFLFTRVIQKTVLYILRWFFHVREPSITAKRSMT